MAGKAGKNSIMQDTWSPIRLTKETCHCRRVAICKVLWLSSVGKDILLQGLVSVVNLKKNSKVKELPEWGIISLKSNVEVAHLRGLLAAPVHTS